MSQNDAVKAAFERMGSRVKISSPTRWQRSTVALNVLRDKEGEFFDLKLDDGLTPEVIDCRPAQRHLVLMVREGRDKNKYLCGHDERQWFVAAVPGDRSVTTVDSAKAALRPPEIAGKSGVIRQGEWFFDPCPGLDVSGDWINPIHKNEPISRGNGSKPHICEELYRRGGDQVWVHGTKAPNGIFAAEFSALPDNEKRYGWRTMTRNAEVYVRGTVRHPDHKTVDLDGWHRVHLNGERFAYHSRKVVFLD